MGIRVVLVDDHRLLREGLRRSLEDEDGIEIVGEAADGESGIRLVVRLQQLRGLLGHLVDDTFQVGPVVAQAGGTLLHLVGVRERRQGA